MSYPLINGAAINDESGGVTTQSIRSVQFGKPVLVQTFQVVSFSTTQFGIPRLKFGTDVELPAGSLVSTQFGVPRVESGMPPANQTYPAASLDTCRWGRPRLMSELEVGPPASIQTSRFGSPAMEFGANPTGLQSTRFGVPGTEFGAHAAGIRPVRFGVARVECSFAAGSNQRVKFGTPRLQLGDLEMGVLAGIHSVHFGVPGLGERAFRARPICTARFGVPMVDRGTVC